MKTYAKAGPKPPESAVGFVRAGWRVVSHKLDQLFGAACTALLLALIATVPIAQLFALGYLLKAARRLVQNGTLVDAFVGVRAASRVGQALLGMWLLSLPWRLLSSLAADAALIDPTGKAVGQLRTAGFAAASLALAFALVALSQGGALIHFFRPLRAAKRWLVQLRQAGYWRGRRVAMGRFVARFAVAETFWLGARGYFAAGVLLALPTTLIALQRVGFGAFLGGVVLVVLLLYLPFLQINFAVHNDVRKMFDVRGVRHLFARAPLAFFFALLTTLTLTLPLYLLKIELVPRDAQWLPAVVFVVTIFPTKLASAWAYRRGVVREEPRHRLLQWAARLLMLPVAIFYALVVILTQYTGWHGVLSLYEHHAFLLPVPF